MDLSILIVSYNVRELLRDCLKSVFDSLASSHHLTAKVWVVDNASADGSAEMVARDFPGVRLIASQDNLGFTGGNNLALQAMGFQPIGDEAEVTRGHQLLATASAPPDAPPRYVLLLNPDTIIQGDALAQMVAFLGRPPACGRLWRPARLPRRAFSARCISLSQPLPDRLRFLSSARPAQPAGPRFSAERPLQPRIGSRRPALSRGLRPGSRVDGARRGHSTGGPARRGLFHVLRGDGLAETAERSGLEHLLRARPPA